MRDMIAVLDGLGSVNPSGSSGANYSGGSSYFSRSPVFPADSGLAGAGRALAQAAMPDGVFPETDSWAEAWVPEGTNVDDAERDFSSYLAAFRGTRTADVSFISPSGSNGANYSGGSAYYGGAPTFPASDGLAGDGSGAAGYSMESVDARAVPGGWATGQRSGGSDYWSGAPTYPSGEGGLAQLRSMAALRGLLGLGAPPQRAVLVARAVVRQGSFSGDPCRQAYQAAFQAARMAGYDQFYANDAAKRVQSRCLALGYAMFSTRA